MVDPLTAMTSLRATRSFTGEDVSDDMLRKIFDVARWTGSARNRQPWRFHTIRATETRADLSRCGAYAAHLKAAPVVVLLALDHSWADSEFDGGRVVQSVLIAAHLFGLGSCPVTFFPQENVQRVTAIAGYAPPWQVRTGIALGHPGPRPTGTSAIPTGRRGLEALWTSDNDDHQT